MALDPDLKMAGPEWQSSLAQAFRKIATPVATEAEIAKRVAFFKDVALLRKRAKDRRAKVNELTREKRDAIKARLDEKKAALKELKELKALKAPKELKGTKRKREAEEEEVEQVEQVEQVEEDHEQVEEEEVERVEMKKTFIYAMEQAMGVWEGEPRLTRFTNEELELFPDARRPPVEYFGMVMDFLNQGDWSKDAIRISFEWSGPVEDVVDAIWSYGNFVRPARATYLATIQQALPDFAEDEYFHFIYLCQYHNKRSLDELNSVFEGFIPDKPRLLKAMAEYISYF
jgi:flagellar biosynthesis GTPase FlhF